MTDHYAPRAGFTPKLRFGPSILDKAEQCPRAYALQYLCGYDTQEPLWSEIADHTYDKDRRVYVAPAGYVGGWETLPSRKRSTALGTECHARVEAHYDGKPEDPARPRWLDFPGQVAQAWLDVMPRPDECEDVYTELPIALWDDAADICLEGTSDLLLKVNERSPFALTFVGDALHTASGYIVADWKTTRDWRYQKKPADLYTNRQGVMYPLAAMRKLDLDAIPGRWAYSITDVKKRREARATDFVQTREHAEARVAEYFAEARVLREKGLRFLALTDGGGAGPIEDQRLEFVKAEYEPNLNACDDYGGCPHSWERGGACTARRSLGARTMASAGACAPAAAVIPLESLLRQSIQDTKGTDMHTNPTERVSPFKLRAQQANAAFQRSAPAPQLALTEAPPPIDPATGLFAVEANDAGALDPQPSAPDAPAAAAPKGKRGRPPGSKNRTSPGGVPLPTYEQVRAPAPVDAYSVLDAYSASDVKQIAAGTFKPRNGVTQEMLDRMQPLAEALVHGPAVTPAVTPAQALADLMGAPRDVVSDAVSNEQAERVLEGAFPDVGLISRAQAADLLTKPLPPGVSPAEALSQVNALLGFEDDAALSGQPRKANAPAAARMITLPEIAAAAQALGCEISIHFPAKVSA